MVFLARIFGEKDIILDEEGELVYYMWRGRGYITHFEQKDEHETINT